MGTIEELKEKMRQGIVEFEFVKKDGTIRQAKGTLVSSYFNYIPKGDGVEKPGVTTYFDMDKNCFRCFRNENFIGIL